MAVMDWLGSITNSLLGAPEEKKETGFSSTGLGGLFYDDKGKFDPRKIGGIVGAIGGGLGIMDDKSPPQGPYNVHMILTVGQEVWDVGIFLMCNIKALMQLTLLPQ